MMERTYLAVRVPQSEGNRQLQARIRSGELQQETVRRLEERCLQALLQYDQGEVSVETALEHVLAYERIHHPKEDRSAPIVKSLRIVLGPIARVACVESSVFMSLCSAGPSETNAAASTTFLFFTPDSKGS